jgi:hypothetical protein
MGLALDADEQVTPGPDGVDAVQLAARSST